MSENTPVISDNLRFPGQYVDRGNGLNYNWNRYYQPKIGRYYQTDPYWGFRFHEKYNYANNNPTLYIDPLGLFGIRDFIRHYYSDDPGPIDLATVGLLEEFKNTRSVRQATNEFANIVLVTTEKLAKNICNKCDRGIISKAYQVDWVARTKVTWASTALFSVGKSSFFSTSNCNLTVNCASKQYFYSCAHNYSIQDAFKQPLTFIGYQGEVGGTPYPINASWNVSVSGRRRFK